MMTKKEAYAATRGALYHGTIERGTACENCGATENVDGHHEDYSQPLDIAWLCRRCHQKLHNLKDPGKSERISKALRALFRSKKSELNFSALDTVRRTPRTNFPKGHTVEQACAAIGVTVQTWYGWQRGDVTCPRARTLAAVKRYMKAAK